MSIMLISPPGEDARTPDLLGYGDYFIWRRRPTSYYHGIAHALADICRFGQLSLAAEILCDNEITIEDLELAEVDDRDLCELREALDRHRT
jgi:hypothetical protein